MAAARLSLAALSIADDIGLNGDLQVALKLRQLMMRATTELEPIGGDYDRVDMVDMDEYYEDSGYDKKDNSGGKQAPESASLPKLDEPEAPRKLYDIGQRCRRITNRLENMIAPSYFGMHVGRDPEEPQNEPDACELAAFRISIRKGAFSFDGSIRDFHDLPTAQHALLYAEADEATFGKVTTQTTEVNHKVRKGRQLSTAHFEVPPEMVRKVEQLWHSKMLDPVTVSHILLFDQ